MDNFALQAFTAVAESGSFSDAAETLHITQPAVSKRIANLEAELGAKLFDRISRKVSLTEAGRALLPQARKILADMESSKRSIRELSGSISGPLSMAISHHIGLHRLPPLLREFSRRHPDVRLDIDFMDSELAYDRIVHGELDLAVITLAPELDPRLKGFTVWPDPLSLVVAADHALAKQRSIDLATLSQHTALPPGLNTYTGQILKALFDDAGLRLDIGLSTNYLETIKVMVGVGLGWSLLPDSLIDNSLKRLPIKGLTLERQLGCVHHRERSLSNAARAFVDMLREAAGQTA